MKTCFARFLLSAITFPCYKFPEVYPQIRHHSFAFWNCQKRMPASMKAVNTLGGIRFHWIGWFGISSQLEPVLNFHPYTAGWCYSFRESLKMISSYTPFGYPFHEICFLKKIALHVHVVSPLSGCKLVFFLNASRQPIMSTIRSWHSKHAACLLAHWCRWIMKFGLEWQEYFWYSIEVWYPAPNTHVKNSADV